MKISIYLFRLWTIVYRIKNYYVSMFLVYYLSFFYHPISILFINYSIESRKKIKFWLTFVWTFWETYLSIASLCIPPEKAGRCTKRFTARRGCRCVSTPFSTSSETGLSSGLRHYAVEQYFCGRVTWASENPKLVVGVILLL